MERGKDSSASTDCCLWEGRLVCLDSLIVSEKVGNPQFNEESLVFIIYWQLGKFLRNTVQTNHEFEAGVAGLVTSDLTQCPLHGNLK